MRIKVIVSARAVANLASRNAADHCPWLDRLCDYRACSYDRTFANRNVREDNGTSANPSPVFDLHWPTNGVECRALRVVLERPHRGLAREIDTLADIYPAPSVERTAGSNNGIGADRDILRVSYF